MAEIKPKSFSDSLMKGDKYLWGIYLTLLAISFVEMYSASSSLAYKAESNSDPMLKHTMFLVAGFIGVIIFQNFKIETIRNWGAILFVMGFLLMIIMPFVTKAYQGAHRSVLGIQPAELCKLGLMIMLSHVITVSQRKTLGGVPKQRFYIMLGMIALICIPIAFQNLSTALIIGFTALCIMLLGNVQLSYLRNLILILSGIAVLGVLLLYPLYQNDVARKKENKELLDLKFLNRAHTWADRIYGENDIPLYQQDPNGENSQTIYAHMALANSYPSPIGRIPGNSQTRDFFPEAYSDYIFAIIFEELGFIGAIVVIGLYLFLLIRSYFIVRHCDDLFTKLVMMSFAILITIQALIHIGVCTGAMFVTGQPLPIISRGGSSIIAMSCAFGILFSISRNMEANHLKEPESEPQTIETV